MSLLDTASLIVTPNGYKEGKLYSVIPSDGSGDLSVTRATTATRVNSAGLVELVPYNQFNYSQKFENAYWIKSNSTITADNTIAPDGTTTADKMAITAGFGAVYASSIPLEGTHTISCFFKKGDASSVYIDTNGTSGNIFGSLNLDTLATSSVGGAIVNVENAGNGWYRLSITASFTGTTSYIAFGILSASTNLFTYLWGAQLVEGSTAKDYQKTETRLNIPRLDYSNGTCPSLLVEPQRTNLFTYSSSFDNADWQKRNNIAVTANATTAPDGTTTADKMYVTNNLVVDYGLFQIKSSTTYAFSVYAKKAEFEYIYLGYNNDTDAQGVFFNLNNGTISQNLSNYSASIEDAGNGWYRCTAVIPSLSYAFISPSLNGTTWLITGQQNKGVYLWGAQLEAGSYATSYIPTTSASVTRNADVISKTGISSLIGQTEGTIFVDFYNYANNSTLQGTPLAISNSGFYGDAIYFEQYLGNWYAAVWNGTSQQFIANAGTLSEGVHRFALAYKANDIAFYVDGNQIATDNSATIPTCARIDLGAIGTSTTPEQMGINAVALWKTRLTNTQLAQLTTI